MKKRELFYVHNVSVYHATTKQILFFPLTLNVHSYEKVALIGNNGSGKTTLLHILGGFLPTINGALHRAPVSYGFIPELPRFNDALTIFSFLHGCSRIAQPTYTQKEHLLHIEEILYAVCLYEQQHALIQTLSKGMRQQLACAQALLHKPELLLADEPFSGLDEHHAAIMMHLFFEQLSCALVFSCHRFFTNKCTQTIFLSPNF